MTCATGVHMTETKSHRQSESAFPKRIAIWVALLLAVYLAYSATHFWGRPDAVADFFAMVVRRLPLMVVQILPPAVFAGALGGCGIFGVASAGVSRRPWMLLATLAFAAYALPALVWPAFAHWTGADWPFPAALLDSARSAQAAAEAAAGNAAARHLRAAANDLGTLIVPIANAAFVLLAAVLGDLTGRLTGGLSVWTRFATRWLSGGALFVAFWIPVAMAEELVQYYAAWGGVLFVLPLCVPSIAAGILFAFVRPDRESRR